MDTKEEIIEEIEDIEEVPAPEEKPVTNKIEDVVMEDVLPVDETPKENEETNNENNQDKTEVETEEVKDNTSEESKEETPEENNDTDSTEPEKKKNKAPLIILLSILLVLDIAALVIYIIGIDKVFSFIK